MEFAKARRQIQSKQKDHFINGEFRERRKSSPIPQRALERPSAEMAEICQHKQIFNRPSRKAFGNAGFQAVVTFGPLWFGELREAV